VASTPERHSTDTPARERKRVAPLELFYDLVFVFAITQVSHLLLNDLSWTGAVHGLLALLIVWWAWDYTVWVTSEVDLEPIAVRLLVLAMMLASLLMAVAVPKRSAGTASCSRAPTSRSRWAACCSCASGRRVRPRAARVGGRGS
jgi:low temperature requirement protein LtrA